MIEKYSCYEYAVRPINEGFEYVIYDPYYKPCEYSITRESDEWYDTAQEANFAAINHIDLLENGEG